MRMAITVLTTALAFATAHPALADKLVLVAGGGAGVEGVLATAAKLKQPFGVDFDGAGNMYIVELGGHRVLKVDAKGRLTILGGNRTKGDRGDGGPASKALFKGIPKLA